ACRAGAVRRSRLGRGRPRARSARDRRRASRRDTARAPGRRAPRCARSSRAFADRGSRAALVDRARLADPFTARAGALGDDRIAPDDVRSVGTAVAPDVAVDRRAAEHLAVGDAARLWIVGLLRGGEIGLVVDALRDALVARRRVLAIRADDLHAIAVARAIADEPALRRAGAAEGEGNGDDGEEPLATTHAPTVAPLRAAY